MSDNINHPVHYNGHPSGIECIEINEHFDYCLGSAFKYIWRYKLKGKPTEDLNKAKWYIERFNANLTTKRQVGNFYIDEIVDERKIIANEKIIKSIREKLDKVKQHEENELKKLAMELIFNLATGAMLFEKLIETIDLMIKEQKELENKMKNIPEHFN